MNERKIVEINPSVIAAQAPVLLRQLLLIAGGGAAVAGMLSAHDMAGLWQYLHSEEFMTVFVAGAGVVSLAWGQWRAHHNNKTLTGIAEDPENLNVVAKNPTPPPAVETE